MRERWTAPGVAFAPFGARDAPLAKAIFESDPFVGALDPTFREYPLTEVRIAHPERSAPARRRLAARRPHALDRRAPGGPVAGYALVETNVYAENLPAFGFWYRNGFDEILGFEPERVDGGLGHCLRLRRSLGTR